MRACELAYAECILAGLRFINSNWWVGLGDEDSGLVFYWISKDGRTKRSTPNQKCCVGMKTAMAALAHYRKLVEREQH